MGTPSNQYVGNEPLLNSVYNDKDSVVKAKSSFINRWKLAVAFVFLIGLVICWISMAEILQSVQKGTNDYHYDKPYFMVYVIHSSYTIFLIICIIWKLIEFLIHKYRSIDTPYTHLDTVRLKRRILVAFCVNPIMMTCAYVWYLSLPLTTISANTGIYNSSCVFVYLFSCLILGEKLKIAKVISVMICIGGVAVMALSHPSVSKDNKDDSVKSVVEDKPKKSDEFVGYLLVILSTALYALYEVLYKKFVDVKQHQLDTLSDSEKTAILHQNSTNNSQDQHHHHSSGLNDTFNTMLFLGLTGLFTLLLFWPIILILHYTKFEVFEYPSDIVWKVISINCGLDSVFNILLLITIMLTSPLFVSVGSLLTIPTSIVADYLFHKLIPYWMSLVGAGLIVIGFLGLNITEYLHEKRLREELTNPNTTKKSFFQRHLY